MAMRHLGLVVQLQIAKIGGVRMEEVRLMAIEVARRILPTETANSRLFHDLQELCLVLIREINSAKDKGRKKDDADQVATSYTDLLLQVRPCDRRAERIQ